MLKLAKRTAAAVFCGILTVAAMPALPANAETPEPQYMTALYDDYDPVGDDVLCINATESADVKIVQHSPERENLVLFDCIVTPAAATEHLFRMEPGNYTIYISMSNIENGVTKSVYQMDFAIDNADYSVAPNQFDHTRYDITLATEALADNAAALPKMQQETEAQVRDNVKYACDVITFGRYTLMRGDYDGNKEITALDAQNVLAAYASALTDDLDPDALTYAQRAACDIDGNGQLTALDAQYILMYYSEDMIGDTPLWPEQKEA